MIDKTTSVGEIVAKNFSTASIFRDSGIDFCCGGNKSLYKACQEKNIDPDEILQRLIHLMNTSKESGLDYSQWSLDFLCDYIINKHHRYVQKAIPELEFYTGKIASVHGENHPGLIQIASIFRGLRKELIEHMEKEEIVLFPAIKNMLLKTGESYRNTIRDAVASMETEHINAGDAMDRIKTLSGGYKVPDDGCQTYQVTMRMLSEFEGDLHVHIHLENNILFRKALAL